MKLVSYWPMFLVIFLFTLLIGLRDPALLKTIENQALQWIFFGITIILFVMSRKKRR